MRLLLLPFLLTACAASSPATADEVVEAPPLMEGQEELILAGGCFWCMESSFEKLPGVVEVVSGYTGGADKPSYKAVGSGKTGHIEAVRVIYDPKVASRETLVEAFWHNIDPTQADGQFCDRGPQYRSALFYGSPEEKKQAERTRRDISKELDQPVVTEILPKTTFWVAEAYHQDFYKKNPAHYQRYRTGCRRDARLGELWGDRAGH